MLKGVEGAGEVELWTAVAQDPGVAPHPAGSFRTKAMRVPELPMQSPELEAAALARACTVDPEVEPGLAPAPLLASQLEEYLLLSLDILALMVPAAAVAEDKPEVTMDLVVMERAVAPAPVLAPPSLPIYGVEDANASVKGSGGGKGGGQNGGSGRGGGSGSGNGEANP